MTKVTKEMNIQMSEIIGKLQFEYMIGQGLDPSHKMLDIGCGWLRGGIRFIGYLNRGNYYGIDKNEQYITQGLQAVRQNGLAEKRVNIMVNDVFQFDRFSAKFDFALAQSVFTHIDIVDILLCLNNAVKVLNSGALLCATFFPCAAVEYFQAVIHMGGLSSMQVPIVTTQFAYDYSVHYPPEMLIQTCNLVLPQFNITYIGEFGHPHGQHMMHFRKI